MRWRGPCSTCRLGWPLRLAAPAPAGRPPGPATRFRFPVSRLPSAFPGVFPRGGVRFRRGCISTP